MAELAGNETVCQVWKFRRYGLCLYSSELENHCRTGSALVVGEIIKSSDAVLDWEDSWRRWPKQAKSFVTQKN